MDWLKNLLAMLCVGILAIAVISIIGIIVAAPTYYLWNWLMPSIFGLKVITFWQAWGLYVLSGILFKSYTYKSRD